MLGLDLIAAHLVADFLFQTDRMAERKLHSARVRAAHAGIHVLVFLPLVLWHARDRLLHGLVFLLLLGLTHFAIDSRRWASGERWAPKPILVDQTLHIVTLAVLARLLV